MTHNITRVRRDSVTQRGQFRINKNCMTEQGNFIITNHLNYVVETTHSLLLARELKAKLESKDLIQGHKFIYSIHSEKITYHHANFWVWTSPIVSDRIIQQFRNKKDAKEYQLNFPTNYDVETKITDSYEVMQSWCLEFNLNANDFILCKEQKYVKL